jgi:hypothetical protein
MRLGVDERCVARKGLRLKRLGDSWNVERLIGAAIAIGSAVGSREQDEESAGGYPDGRRPGAFARRTIQNWPSSALGPYIDGTGTSFNRR